MEGGACGSVSKCPEVPVVVVTGWPPLEAPPLPPHCTAHTFTASSATSPAATDCVNSGTACAIMGVKYR